MKDLSLEWIDWLIVGIYLSFLFAFCIFLKTKAKTINSNKRFPPKMIGLSIYATSLSSITFLSTPASSFSTTWAFSFGNLTICLLTPLLIYIFLPLFRTWKVQSLLESIQKRYSRGLEVITVMFYVMYNIFKISLLIYLPAMSLNLIIGSNSPWTKYILVFAVALVTIAYAYLTNLRQLVLINCIQSIFIFTSIILTLIFLIVGVHNLGTISFTDFVNQGKLFKQSDFLFSLTSATIPVIMIAQTINTLFSYAFSKDITQHYGKAEHTNRSAISLKINAFLSIITIFLFYSVGSLLWCFFTKNPDCYRFDEQNELLYYIGGGEEIKLCQAENIVTCYMWHVLPAGVSGIAIVGVFAASQSSIASSLRAVGDLVSNVLVKKSINKKMFNSLMVYCCGIIATIIAAGFCTLDYLDNVLEFFVSLSGLYSSAILAVLIFGSFNKRISNVDAYIGGGCGLIAALITFAFSINGKYINNMYIPIFGFVVAATVVSFCGFLHKIPEENLTNRFITTCMTNSQKRNFKYNQHQVVLATRYHRYLNWIKIKNLFLRNKIEYLKYKDYCNQIENSKYGK